MAFVCNYKICVLRREYIAFAVWFIFDYEPEVLPVHWYHLFVLIRYHKKTDSARWNII